MLTILRMPLVFEKHRFNVDEVGKNRCLVFLNDLILFCGVILLLLLFCLMNQGRTKGEGWSTANKLKLPSDFNAGRPKAALLF